MCLYSPLRRLACAALAAGVLLLVGCEEDVLLVDDTERAFTLYGILNPKADTQYVHVFPIEGTLRPTPPAPLDAAFTSTDGRGGAARAWTDSVIVDRQQQYGHVFYAPFRVEHERSYRLEIEGADGNASRVEVTVPPLVRARIGEPRIDRRVVYTPIRLEGATPDLLRLEITYWARAIVGFEGPSPLYFDRQVTIPYDSVVVASGGAWTLPINLTRAFQHVRDSLSVYVDPAFVHQYGVDLLLMTLDVIVASDTWDPPDGLFDPLTLSHPGVLTNVENGFGFVGAGYRVQHKWRPPREFLEAAGFVPPR